MTEDKTVEKPLRPQNRHLKRDAGPGRPKGQRNYATIYRVALKKLAEKENLSPDDLEAEIVLGALTKAKQKDLGFYKDVMDRMHGKPMQKTLNVESDIKTSEKELQDAADTLRDV